MSIFNNLNNLNTLNYSSSRYNDVIYRTESSASLDLNFARNKSLIDSISGNNLITFTRASSGTFVGDDGLIQTATTNVPRFDHNPVTRESLGLLIEEQKTNLVLRSEEFDNASWNSAVGARSISANSIVAPDGLTTADTVTADGTSAAHFVSQSVTLSAVSYAYSVFAKAGTNNFLQLRCFSNFGGMFANFNLSTGVLGTVGTISGAAPTSSIRAYSNGWYRCTMVFTPTAATSSVAAYIVDSASATSGETNSLSTNFYLWGAQLEANAFPTSYIPTTTATVTRSADVASITGTNFSSWYNQTQGTMFADAKRDFEVPSGPFTRVWQIQGALNTSRVELSFFNGGQASFIATSGVTQFEWYPMYFIQNGIKSAQALDTNNVAAATNGQVTATDTSVTLPTVQEIRIGGDGGVGNTLNGTIRRLTYFPTRLSNTTLQNITR